MKDATTWKPISEVLGRLAAKLAAQMDKRGGHAGAHTLDDVTASSPGREERGIEGSRNRGFENSTGAGQSHEAGMKGLAARDPIQRAASAEPVRRAMQVSGGK